MINILRYIIFFFLMLFCFASCEKVVLDDDSKKETTNHKKTQPDDSDDEDSGDDIPVIPGDRGNPKGDDGGGQTAGSTYHMGDTLTVTQFISGNVSKQVYVVGYIVGTCYKKHDNIYLDPPFKYKSSILMADHPRERDPDKMMSVQLSSTIQKVANLKDHPENLGKAFYVFGMQTSYLGFYGMKSIGDYGFFESN